MASNSAAKKFITQLYINKFAEILTESVESIVKNTKLQSRWLPKLIPDNKSIVY